MFSGSLKRLGFMPERFQAAFEAQRVGSECPPYLIWVFCKNNGLPCKPLPTRIGINRRNADSRGGNCRPNGFRLPWNAEERVGSKCPPYLIRFQAA